jgi:hypothetical protein
LIVNYPGLAQRAARDGLGFWLTFEGYVRNGVKSGALVSVLDWCAPFPYYPSQAPAAARARRLRGFRHGMAKAGEEEERWVTCPHAAQHTSSHPSLRFAGKRWERCVFFCATGNLHIAAMRKLPVETGQ